MGWLFTLLTIVPVFLFWRSGYGLLAVLSGLNAVVSFWSHGVMHNYAVDRSAHRIKQLRANLEAEGPLDPAQQAALDALRLRVNPNTV